MEYIMSKFKKTSSSKATIPGSLLLRLANERKNPLKLLPEYDASSESETSLTLKTARHSLLIKYHLWNEFDQKTQDWIIDLTEHNMKQYDEKSAWGWNRQSKIGEFKNKTAKFLLVFDNEKLEQDPIAFVHFRFEEGYASDPILYCYELQIVENYRRQGIGRCLMNLLSSLASHHRMRKVLLTVLKINCDALEFYTNALGFQIDKASPSRCEETADYEILFRKAELVPIE